MGELKEGFLLFDNSINIANDATEFASKFAFNRLLQYAL